MTPTAARPTRALPLALVLAALAVLAAWGTAPAQPAAGQEETPTYPPGGRCRSIDYRDAVIDQIRGFAATVDAASLPTLVRVALERPMPPGGWPMLASYADTGPVFGLAYDGIRNRHYLGARPRAFSLLGTRRPGQIYEVDPSTEPPTTRPWAVLDAGPQEADVGGGAAYYALIDRWGLGDLELDDQAQWLFAVNLFDRRVYRLGLPDGAVLGSFANGASREPWSERARPFGLGWFDGWLYHGVVDEQALVAYVYRSRADGSGMTEVLRAALPSRWHQWQEPVTGMVDQPILADIEFRPNGDLILGLRNRTHDVNAPYNTYDQGEVLATRREGDRWEVVPGQYNASTRRWA